MDGTVVGSMACAFQKRTYNLAASRNWGGAASGNGSRITLTKQEASGRYTGQCADKITVSNRGGTIQYSVTDSLTTATT